MSALIHLARHASHAELGDVLSGRSDIGLSPDGREQAARLAERLAETPLAAIHAGPRRRTQETAQVVAERLGMAVETVDALDEIDFGAWAGRRFAELAADPAWERWNSARGETLPPDGESMVSATARAVAHVEGIASDSAGPVLLVSHCDIIRGVIAHYLGLPLGRLLAFDVDPASLSTLSVGDWGGRLVQLNERPA